MSGVPARKRKEEKIRKVNEGRKEEELSHPLQMVVVVGSNSNAKKGRKEVRSKRILNEYIRI